MENPLIKTGKIDRLSDKLNVRGSPSIINEKPNTLSGHTTPSFGSNWNETERLDEFSNESPKNKKNYFLKLFFIIALVFFIISAGIASFAIFTDFNNVSSKNVDISVLGPTSIGGGENLLLEIVVENKNNITLEKTDLLIEFPSGTRTATDVQKEFLRYREPLGVIESGDNVRRTIQAVLFGEKESVQKILVSVEYRVKGSNAIFVKEKEYEIAITSSPITLTASYPKEISSNKEFEIVLTAISNSASIIKDALVKAEYPFGYTFGSAIPKPISGEDLWRLGDLKPGEKRMIKLKGVIDSQNNEERTFRFSTGISSNRDENIIGAEFVTIIETVSIKKSGLGIELFLEDSRGTDSVVVAGSKVSGKVLWINNLSVPIVGAKIEVRFSGSVLNRSSVFASDNGFYRSIDNTIIWDRNSNLGLANIAPGESGELSFSFGVLGFENGLPLSNQSVELEASGSGSQLSGGSVPENILTSVRQKVSIASDIGLNTRIVHSIGPFVNKGTLPPKVEKEITYTVIWSATNSSNDISDSVVKAVLPSYVTWLDAVTPSKEIVSYDAISRTITWSVGDIRAGSGFSFPPKEVSFQISFVPSLSQVGTTPDLVGETLITGRDKFTNAFLTEKKSALTTRLGTDPAFKNDDGRITN